MPTSVTLTDLAQRFSRPNMPETYDRLVRPRVFEPWARVLLDFVGLAPDQAVLDVATGPGTVARLAAERVGPAGQVTATDISAPMLALASAKPRVAGMACIEYMECSASALAVLAEVFDIVLCQHGVQQFPDAAAALAEMRRALKPGGSVGMATWDAAGPMPLAVGGYNGQGPGASPTRGFGRDPDELALLLANARFHDVHVEQKTLPVTWEGGIEQMLEYLPYSRRGEELMRLSIAEREACLQPIRRELEPFVEGGVLRYTTRANLARAVKPAHDQLARDRD